MRREAVTGEAVPHPRWLIEFIAKDCPSCVGPLLIRPQDAKGYSGGRFPAVGLPTHQARTEPCAE